jgi:hypothetical protein
MRRVSKFRLKVAINGRFVRKRWRVRKWADCARRRRCTKRGCVACCSLTAPYWRFLLSFAQQVEVGKDACLCFASSAASQCGDLFVVDVGAIDRMGYVQDAERRFLADARQCWERCGTRVARWEGIAGERVGDALRWVDTNREGAGGG